MTLHLRCHLDENVNHAIAHGLRLRGIDVTNSTQAKLLHASDEEQLAFASGTQRVLVTHDDDYLVLHQQGISHAGIAYSRPHARRIGDIIRGLSLMWGAMTPEEMKNRVRFL